MTRLMVLLALTAVMAFGAVAEEDDFVMGNYEGSVAGDGWEGRSLRVQVATVPGWRYRAVLYVGVDGQEEQRFEVKGKRRKGTVAKDLKTPKAKKAVVVDFEGDVDLGGGCAVKASLTDETLTGTIGGGKFALKRVFLKPPTLGAKPPEGAIVLYDNEAKDLSAWDALPHWRPQGSGSFRISPSNLATKDSFGDVQIHLEFKTPFMPGDSGQARGNSGVYVMGRYEVQVLDSFGDLPKDNLCGGIYQKAVPIVCASLPPLQWQTYDITLRAPKFDANGKKTKDAVITVLHNGITIHDTVVLPDVTPGGVSGEEAPKGPLMVQHHGDYVDYGNIWVKPLD